ncbi:hypothetical protein OC834_002204 [Tilletia horrida]|nr:hypothetical protein OC834_002204 [Tilletia horrida]
MATIAVQSSRPSHRLHQSFPPAGFVQDGVSSSPLLSSLEREAILTLSRRTLSLRRKASSNSLFAITKSIKSPVAASPSATSDASPKTASSKQSSWVRRVSDAFSMTRRDSSASSIDSRHSSAPSPFPADLHEDESTAHHNARQAFDEIERPAYELMFDPQPRLRRQTSDESFQCRGLSTSSSTDCHPSPASELRKLDRDDAHTSYCSIELDDGRTTSYDRDSAVLHTRTSFSNFSISSEASGSSLTSTSDYALPITPSSVERPLRPKTRPPSLSLNDNEILAIEDLAHSDKFSALGIYDAITSSHSSVYSHFQAFAPPELTPTALAAESGQDFMLLAPPPAMSSLPNMGGPRRSASCDGRCGFSASSSSSTTPTRHTPRLDAPTHAVDDVRLWVRFVGLPSDEALDSISVSAKLSHSSLRSPASSSLAPTGTVAAVAAAAARRTNNPPVAPFEINPLSTVAQLKARLAEMVHERFGLAVSADELTVSMHSIVSGLSQQQQRQQQQQQLLSATSPTLRLSCSGASSDAGTATPHMMPAAWSSTASLPSLSAGSDSHNNGCGVSAHAYTSTLAGGASSIYSGISSGNSFIGKSGRPMAALFPAAAPPPLTIVTELRQGECTLWNEGVEDGFTLVARIRSLAFF